MQLIRSSLIAPRQVRFPHLHFLQLFPFCFLFSKARTRKLILVFRFQKYGRKELNEKEELHYVQIDTNYVQSTYELLLITCINLFLSLASSNYILSSLTTSRTQRDRRKKYKSAKVQSFNLVKIFLRFFRDSNKGR